ncbi:MAG TPA: hypothetical protein VMA98_02945 [Candidatus Acidoferrales bacterium]|nr:hypothetical protein [Candidatus Acidoferrales bacterium]
MSLLRRLAVAGVLALALHAAAVTLIPALQPLESEHSETLVARVTIVRTRTPTPAPAPTPPPHRLLAQTLVPAGTHARVEPVKHLGARRPTPPKVVAATPDASLPSGGTGAGAQQGAAAGSLSATNGNGNGTGATGSGNGAALCGAVDFESMGSARFDAQSGEYLRSNIIATVYYTDGTSERIPLNWTWRYKSEADDPFNPSSSALMLFQFPPAEQRASEPAAILYIIAHTRADGTTTLNDQCPNIPARPTAPALQPGG